MIMNVLMKTYKLRNHSHWTQGGVVIGSTGWKGLMQSEGILKRIFLSTCRYYHFILLDHMLRVNRSTVTRCIGQMRSIMNEIKP